MKEQLLARGKKLWADFVAFSPGQKAVTIAAALALVIGGYLFFSWKSKPTYAPLYTNLATSDASAIVDKLTSDKIPYRLAAGGSEILVPQDKVYSTRLTMSSAGLPDSNQTGYSLLDKEGVTTSQFQQQVDYQRAIEGELAKTIEAMQGVQAASVHLGIPQQNVFNDGTQKPTAAVMLTTTNGTTLTAEQVQSIVYLVSSSVPNMDANDVTVTDSAGQVLSAPGSGVTDATTTSSQTQTTRDYDQWLAGQLQAQIDKIVGAGNSVVTANATLDFNQTSTTTNRYVWDKNAPPLSESTSTETYAGNGAAANAGTLGAGTPATNSTQTGNGNGNYKKTNTTKDNALGTEKQTVVNAPGSVKQLAISVLVNGTSKTVNVPAISSLVKSATGLSAARGDTLSVQAMPFNTSAATQAQKAATAAAKAAAAKAAHEHRIALMKQGALGALILAIVVGTWLASRRRKNHPDPVEPIDTFLDESLPPLEPAPAPVPDNVMDINEAISQRRALVALADEQPDDVARVLSGWLGKEA